MTSSILSPTVSPEADRYARVRETATFRNGGHDRLLQARILVIGAGAAGCQVAMGLVQTGASVGVVDFDIGAIANQGTQRVEPGVPKVKTVVAACDAIDPGRAAGFQSDVRHLGVGLLSEFDVLVDCTDDANLALPLTELSNGIARPLLRVALNGNGESEMGRVLCSSGATGHACQICSYRIEDLRPNRRRTGCPVPARSRRAATIASGAMAMSMGGLGVLCIERIVTGNDVELVLGHEIYLDFTNYRFLPMRLNRSDRCLTGHLRWDLTKLRAAASGTTFAEVFSAACDAFSTAEVTLEPYRHPLNVQAECECGRVVDAVGTNWASPPRCSKCGKPMSWRRTTQHDRLSQQLAQSLGMLDKTLTQLGIPETGAMIVARAAARPPIRYVLDAEPFAQPQ